MWGTTAQDFEDMARRLVFDWVSAGLTTPHAFVLALALSIGHLRHYGQATAVEVALLAGVFSDLTAHPGDPQAFGTSSAQMIRLRQLLKDLPVLTLLERSFRANPGAWREYFAAGCTLVDETPLLLLPNDDRALDKELTTMQKLLLWALFAPTCLQDRCRELIIGTLGDRFVQRGVPRLLDALLPAEKQLDSAAKLEEAEAMSPGGGSNNGSSSGCGSSGRTHPRARLIMVATCGIDVVQEVLAKGVEWCGEGRVRLLGPDTAPTTAATAITAAAEEGSWVILQNLHLAAPAFTQQVGHLVQAFRGADDTGAAAAAHDRFALIITTSVGGGVALPPAIALLCDTFVVEQPLTSDPVSPSPGDHHSRLCLFSEAALIIGRMCANLGNLGAPEASHQGV